MSDPVTFSGQTITVQGKQVQVDYPVAEAFLAGDKLIVLYDPDAYTKGWGQFPNLEAFMPNDEKLWTAELPTTTSGDRYYQISSHDPLKADSIYSYSCEIDLSTGKITHKTFYR